MKAKRGSGQESANGGVRQVKRAVLHGEGDILMVPRFEEEISL